MKTLLVAVNSKYIHSNLAVWYLKAACGKECGEITVREYTINDSLDAVFAGIYKEKADVVAFSCYIWNVAFVLAIAANLKKVSPNTRIILGGPEVSFDGIQLMEENPAIDYLISGEGEETAKLVLGYLNCGSGRLTDLRGLAYRAEGRIYGNCEYNLIRNLDELPSPYTEEMLSTLNNRIVYYEASRGCPFSCSYCISSTFKGIRHLSLERVKKDLDKLVSAGVRQIKFVDRTFNCNKKRAIEIITYIIDKIASILQKDPQFYINFHFEAAADLFDGEMLEVLSKVPAGFIQFEIGVQTTNTKTLEAVNRKTDTDRVFYGIRSLKATGSFHLHLDLIAGLPFENFDSFMNSFNEVYSLKPDQLQLGFLKMLKGSGIRREAELHGYSYRDYPPYEILGNNYISFDELLILKEMEDVLERYCNSGRFIKTLDFVIQRLFPSPFSFFRAFSEFMKEKGHSGTKMSSRQQYTVLLEFLDTVVDEKQVIEIIIELLKLDYLSSDNSNNLPEGIERQIIKGFKESCFEFLKKEGNVERFLPAFTGIPAKQIFKQVHFEAFGYDVSADSVDKNMKKGEVVILFDYSSKDRVTGLYRYYMLDGFTPV